MIEIQKGKNTVYLDHSDAAVQPDKREGYKGIYLNSTKIWAKINDGVWECCSQRSMHKAKKIVEESSSAHSAVRKLL